MKLDYNAPVVLTFALACFAVMLLSEFTNGLTTSAFFTSPPVFNRADPLDYGRLLSHVLGHHDWQHLIGNLAVILLIGPLVEEKYGSSALLLMFLVTAAVTALLNTTFFGSALLGASGLAFMFILLTSITNLRQGRLPITFVLAVLLYLVPELLAATRPDSISQMAHIVGGLCGSLFGFVFPERSHRDRVAGRGVGTAAVTGARP